ncbi:ATP-dependent helicase [bacterium]|nr:ATP-dependent helicase [bacterium]
MLFNSNDDKKNLELFLSTLNLWIKNTDKNKKICVVVQNPQQKQIISDFLDANKIFCKNIYLTTFAGIVYNTILNNKNYLPQNIKNVNLVGLDASQYVLKQIIKEVGFKDYKSQINILHQLFRRYSLIVQNDLTQEEIITRSKIADESYIEETQKALELYRQKTNELGSFDYLRQLTIFKYLIQNNSCFEDIEYLCVFNCEEFSPIFYKFLSNISANLKDSLIFFDKNGATRIGYLCAEPNCEEKLLNIFKTEIKTIQKQSIYSKIAQKLEEHKDNSFFENNEFLYRSQMINAVKSHIKKLLNDGVKLNEIGIITPVNDETLTFNLADNIFYYLSGSTKLIDDYGIKNIIFFYDLLNENLDLSQMQFEFNDFLSTFYNNEKQDFISIKQELLTIKSLSEKILFLHKELTKNFKFNSHNEKNINFLIKQTKDFEKIYYFKTEDITFQEEILSQLKISVISENSSDAEKIPQDKIIVATEQKFIDTKLEKKHVFILDTTSIQWLKNDIGPMYNAWVMQKNYDKKSFDLNDNLYYSKLKINRIFRKILLQTTQQLYLYSSTYDTLGQENYSGLIDFIKYKEEETKKEIKPFMPRPDQAKVLEYTSKNLAIAAVPGAGKTTILLELVKKLIKNGIKSENIFVLTYMDSAAKNFKERLNLTSNNTNLPNISTIHGLALRIIKENFNFTRLNLDENFNIIDDTKRSILFAQAFYSNKCKDEYFTDFERGISIMKFTQQPNLSNVNDYTLKEFLKVYKTYCNLLNENNLIDYDDMLVLAVKLLKENNDILKYYQNICHYIIEDEAQDSSLLQQELLSLLSGKHKNLIRCGDLNQAITATFTNADVDGFKNFINQNKNLKMTSSQRCAKHISVFANKLNSIFAKSFYPIQITQPIQEKSQIIQKIDYSVFEEEVEEITNIANTIKSIQTQNPKSQIAILVRNNYQVEKYEKILNQNGIQTLIKEGILGQQKIFLTIFSVLKILNNINNQSTLEDNYEILCNLGIYNKNEKINEKNQFWWDIKYFKTLKSYNFPNIITKIGYFYFDNEIDRANVEILTFLTKRICNEKSSFSQLLEEFEKLSKKPLNAFFKFFEKSSDKTENSSIQIMTIHKSKGDEFDYVFLPEFSNENFPIIPENYKIHSEDMFLENIKALNRNYNKKTRSQLQQFICDETLKLIYVAITRAKKQLYISFSNKIKRFNKPKNATELTQIIELI